MLYYIYNKYKNIKLINFIGVLSREQVFAYYDYSDVLIFPSKLETWGLPISEFKEFKKIILLSNLPYAKETIGYDYPLAYYFNPYDFKSLEKKILEYLKNELSKESRENKEVEIKDENYKNWEDLFKKILRN